MNMKNIKRWSLISLNQNTIPSLNFPCISSSFIQSGSFFVGFSGSSVSSCGCSLRMRANAFSRFGGSYRFCFTSPLRGVVSVRFGLFLPDFPGLSQPPEPVRLCPGVSGVSGLTSSTSIARPPPAAGCGGSVPPSWDFRPNIAAPQWRIAPADRSLIF